MKTVLMMLALALSFPTANASTIIKGSRACIDEEHFDQQVRAKNDNDGQGLTYLFKNGYCIIINGDYPVSVIDSTWSGKVKVRLYTTGEPVEFWTYFESVKD